MNHSDTILSPVTHAHACEKIASLDASKIRHQYREELGLDVSRYLTGDHIDLYQCPETRYRFFHPSSLMGDGAFYEDLEERSGGAYYPTGKWEYTQALKQMKAGDRMLEIGCGNGAFIQLCAAAGITNVTGLELNSKEVADLQSKKIDAHNQTIEAYAATEPPPFDVVCAFQVLEHVYDVHEFISGALQCLRAGGKLILGVPNSNPFLFKSDRYNTLNLPPHHIGLWNEEAFRKTGAYFGLHLVQVAIEPFNLYKGWFLYHRNRLIEKNKAFSVLRLIPRPAYKLFVRAISPFIEGSSILAVFQKPIG